MHHRERFRVLIADPDPRRARRLGFALEMSGLFTATAGDADTLVRRIDEQSPHLILLDLRLPVPDGHDGSLGFVAWLRAQHLLADTPVFGLADGRDRALAAAAEFELDRVLWRSLPITDLVATIHATQRRRTAPPTRPAPAVQPAPIRPGYPAPLDAPSALDAAVPPGPEPVRVQKQALMSH